jgi:hypothetical protein
MDDERPGPRLGRVIGVPTHSQPLGFPLTGGAELSAVGYDERWPGYVLCGSLEGHSGWVPEAMLVYLGPGIAVVRGDFTARVLSTAIGDVLTLHAQSNGWYWATREDGHSGWVLAAHVQFLEEA